MLIGSERQNPDSSLLSSGSVGRKNRIDVRRPFAQVNVFAEEVLIYRIVLNDIVGDVVQDHQVRLWRKDDAVIRGSGHDAGGVQHRHGDVLVRETTVSDA